MAIRYFRYNISLSYKKGFLPDGIYHRIEDIMGERGVTWQFPRGGIIQVRTKSDKMKFMLSFPELFYNGS